MILLPVGNVTTKYYSINITGTGNATNFSLPTKSSNLELDRYNRIL